MKTKTEDLVDLSQICTRDIHHIPLHGNLNAQVAYCGEGRHGRVPFIGIPWKPICQTCQMLWEIDGKPSGRTS